MHIQLHLIVFACNATFHFMLHSTAQLSMTHHGTKPAQHSTAQHSTAQHGTARHSTAKQSRAQHLGVELVGVEVHKVGGQGPGPHPLPQRLTLQIHTVHQQMLCTQQHCFPPLPCAGSYYPSAFWVPAMPWPSLHDTRRGWGGEGEGGKSCHRHC